MSDEKTNDMMMTTVATLEVNGEEVKLDSPGSGGGAGDGGRGVVQVEEKQGVEFVGGVDYELPMTMDRDPYHWHDQVKIKFEDIFGEADFEVYSFDNIWATTNKVYTLSKYWCYRVTSLVLAVPLAAIWGVYFALLTFCRSWCCVPCLKACDLELHCVRRLAELLLRTFAAPCFEAAGRCFYHIRMRIIKGEDALN